MFRFENHWAKHPNFLKIVELHWINTAFYANAAKTLSAKFKQVRTSLRQWRKGFHNFNKILHNSEWVLLLDGIEEQRPLSNLEAP
jgi:hypothetical protein